MTTAAARNIVKNIIGTSADPLTTKEIYQLALKKFPKATVSKPALTYGNPPLKAKLGGERQEPPSAPRPDHPIASMTQLKQRILPDLVARNELVKVHVKRPAGAALAQQQSASSSKTTTAVDPSTVKQVDTWVWKFPQPSQPPRKDDAAGQAALTPKIPQRPDEPEPQFKRPNSTPKRKKTHAEMYPATPYVHLNSRRRKGRAEKVARDREWKRLSAYSTTKSIPIPTTNGDSNAHLHPSTSSSMSQPRSIPRSNSVQTSDFPPFSTSPLHRTGSITSTSPTLSTVKHHHDFRPPKVLHQLDSGDLKVLILENISQQAVKAFKDAGFQVDFFTKAWSEEELVEKIGQYHAIGIRSKTKITAKVLKAAAKLLVIGCFCIGTNQVDLETASKIGIPVFNSPFSNSRSVAELVMSEVIALSRQLVDRANEMRQGTWNKVSKSCWEVRGKTLGIVGYGHIGSQLSVLAEAFAMRVLYYDVLNIMPLGNATQ
ncbi:hypothetical protein FRB90_005757, partial [Tulasnella sp. 427]